MMTSDTRPVDIQEWRPIPGYEGFYEVSSWGNVRRIKAGRGTRPGTEDGRVLKTPPGRSKSGIYKHVELCIPGIRRTSCVHVLVALAFLGPRPVDEFGEYEVRHINMDRQDNRLENLEYRTAQEHRELDWAERMSGR